MVLSSIARANPRDLRWRVPCNPTGEMGQPRRLRHADDDHATVRFERVADTEVTRVDPIAATTVVLRRPPAPRPAATPAPRVMPEPPAPAGAMPRVVVADRDRETAGWVARRLAGIAEVVPVTSAAGAVALFRAQAVPVALVGAHLDDAPGDRLIAALTARAVTTVIAIAPAAATAAPPAPGIFYQIDRALDRDAVRQVVTCALARRPKASAELADPMLLQRLAAAARRVALQRSAGDVARAIAEVVPGLVDADRASCLFFDGDSGMLWAEPEPGGAAVVRPATGLLGFAARTATPVVVERAGADPRYRPTADDPGGGPDLRLAVVPIVDPDGEVHAVIVAARADRAPAFVPAERALLIAFAARVAPAIDAFALEARAEALAPPRDPGQFRPEALAAYQARQDEGGALRIAPGWASATYWLVLGFVLVALVYLCVARIDEHAEGPAIVIAEGHRPVTLASRGVVGEVLVTPGAQVAAGDELFRIHDDLEVADAAAIDREFEQRLVDRLERPDDDAAAASLSAVIARRRRVDLARAQRVIRAPVAGVVADIRIRTGQTVEAGAEALTIVDGAAPSGASLIALVPAGQAPLVRPGMSMRMQLAGHRGVFTTVTIDSVSTDATGPASVRQLLGDGLADTLAIVGPVVVVRARLPSAEFIADGRPLAFRHGMTGRASVRVRSQRLITALVPGLAEVLGDDQ